MKTFAELKTNYKGIVPAWYTTSIHEEVMHELGLTGLGKLQVVKHLCSRSNENNTRSEFGLKQAKDMCDFIDGFVSGQVETNDDRDFLIEEVAGIINDEIQKDYDTSGLMKLLRHIPSTLLKTYLNENEKA